MSDTPPTKEQLKKEKQRLVDNITNIEGMSYAQVEEYRAKIGLSAAKDRVKHFLIKACNLREAQIYNSEKLLAVYGDMDDFN